MIARGRLPLLKYDAARAHLHAHVAAKCARNPYALAVVPICALVIAYDSSPFYSALYRCL